MLVLSRDPGESIVLWTKHGDRVLVKISKVDAKGQVKLAVDAPPSVHVDRLEVYSKKVGSWKNT